MNESRRSFVQKHSEDLSKSNLKRPKKEHSVSDIGGLKPYPAMRLNKTLGFSGRYCPDVRWSRSQVNQRTLVYASGALVISSEVDSNNQRFFLGHTAPVSTLDLSRDGMWIVSAQEGQRGLLRIWDFEEN